MREADELAKRYWEVRDQAKALEAHAKQVAAEANEEERDAEKKRVTVSLIDIDFYHAHAFFLYSIYKNSFF